MESLRFSCFLYCVLSVGPLLRLVTNLVVVGTAVEDATVLD
jgi:hypothetical protein